MNATNAAAAIQHIRNGGRALVATCTRATVIDAKCLARWEKSGHRLIWDAADGKGIRLAQGKSNVYLMPGQLQLID